MSSSELQPLRPLPIDPSPRETVDWILQMRAPNRDRAPVRAAEKTVRLSASTRAHLLIVGVTLKPEFNPVIMGAVNVGD